ncbi:MAG: galactosyltransferase-related protein [Methanococcaceae archaeon]
MTCVTGKTDLSDFTFLFPVRIDSLERAENLNTVINFISSHFETSFIIVEADSQMKYDSSYTREGIRYEFHPDTNSIFHKTKYINLLIRLAETKSVAVWDTDVITTPAQILNSASIIRKGEAGMSIPYNGRVFVCDHSLSAFFRSHPKLEILERLSSSLSFMYGYHSTGGAFIVNRDEYMESGGENENFYGWGPEDVDRVKRMETLGIPVHFAGGPMFHLWHPRGITSRYADKSTEKLNRQEFIKTCATINISEC